jgi:nucleotide-binding universal stress UspA family protein
MDRPTDLVVVGVDDSTGGRAALRFALSDAARRGARVVAIAAFRRPPEDVWGVGGTALLTVAQVHDDVRARVTQIVDEVRSDLGGIVAPPVTVLAVAGGAGEVLVHAARTADLLVVGSRSRSALGSAVLGSVSAHCVRQAQCPVTVVHPVRDRVAATAALRS